MNRYLLDTNIISEIVKHPGGRLARRAEASSDELCTSIIVVAELQFWLVKRPSVSRRASLGIILAPLDILAVDTPADQQYAIIRAAIEAAGTPIGSNDLLIAAQAVTLGLTVVTDNEREFRRVPGLAVENWLRD